MHKLTIHELGPIHDFCGEVKEFTVITGIQSAGKSTIAKALYFFRSIKRDFLQLILRNQQKTEGLEPMPNFRHSFSGLVRDKFLGTFGSSYAMNPNMSLRYDYDKNTWIQIRLVEDRNKLAPNFVSVKYSTNIQSFLDSAIPEDSNELRQRLSVLFNDPYEAFYIPAGRSLLTVLGSQLNYIYSTMDDRQKRQLDSCTRDYLEQVLLSRPLFSNGIQGLIEGIVLPNEKQAKIKTIFDLTKQILKGKYSFSNGEDKIQIDNGRYVKMNFASSGQQEIVWILNLLTYYLVQEKKTFFVIEEPESHLFPESQKLVVDFISLFAGAGNRILLTTHSPYVLGEINNLLYAYRVGQEKKKEAEKIIPSNYWINPDDFTALFIEDGKAQNLLDMEMAQLDGDRLNSISHVINADYDALFELNQQEEKDK